MNNDLTFSDKAVARALAPSIPGIAAAIAVAADQLVLAEHGEHATLFHRDAARQAIMEALADFLELVEHNRQEPYPTLHYSQLSPFYLLAWMAHNE